MSTRRTETLDDAIYIYLHLYKILIVYVANNYFNAKNMLITQVSVREMKRRDKILQIFTHPVFEISPTAASLFNFKCFHLKKYFFRPRRFRGFHCFLFYPAIKGKQTSLYFAHK